jgi:hypothetical protein
MPFPPPQLPPQPEMDLKMREREARDRISRGFITPPVWYIAIGIIVLLVVVLLVVYGFHWF